MTIEELEETLPNGFHDSQIVSISVNFLVGTCCIELDVDHDDPDPDVFKRMKLQLKDVSLVAIEPPDPKIDLSTKETVWASGHPTSEKILPALDSYRKSAPPNTFFYSFFLHELNCHIHLGAKEATLEEA
jgi:hypothetical protein